MVPRPRLTDSKVMDPFSVCVCVSVLYMYEYLSLMCEFSCSNPLWRPHPSDASKASQSHAAIVNLFFFSRWQIGLGKMLLLSYTAAVGTRRILHAQGKEYYLLVIVCACPYLRIKVISAMQGTHIYSLLASYWASRKQPQTSSTFDEQKKQSEHEEEKRTKKYSRREKRATFPQRPTALKAKGNASLEKRAG